MRQSLSAADNHSLPALSKNKNSRAKLDLPSLLLRADANARVGHGHLMRCLAFGSAWVAGGGEATLLSDCADPKMRRRFAAAGVRSVLARDTGILSAVEVARQLERKSNRRPWIVLDGYEFTPAQQSRLRSAGRLLVLDDTAHLPRYEVDVLLNQNLGAEALRYNCNADALLLLGSRYALLRPEFLAWRGWTRRFPAVASKILVTLGGSDAANETGKVMRALGRVKTPLEAVALVGASNPHLPELTSLAKRLPHPMRLVHNAVDVARYMAWADLAVTAGGTTCWEAAFMGLPSLVGIAAENQRPGVERLQKAGAAVSLGDYSDLSEAKISANIASLAAARPRREELGVRGRRIIDGFGADRLLRIIAALEDTRGDRLPLTLRPVTNDDALPIFRIANDPAVRRHSFKPQPIPLKRHMRWLEGILASSENRFYVLDLDGAITAQARYTRLDAATAEVHFSVAAPFRGKGIGTRILADTGSLAFKELRVQRLRGSVILPNAASERAFVSAGYRKIQTTKQEGRLCAVFERAR